MTWMIAYRNADGIEADCHPDFFKTKRAAEKEAARFMALLNWAVSYRIYKTEP